MTVLKRLAALVVLLGLGSLSLPAAALDYYWNDYDYYDYYDAGYAGTDYDNDWFYDYYNYDAGAYDAFYPYYYDYDYDTDLFEWEETGLFD